MKIDTNTPVAELCERLREICVGDCLLSDDKQFLTEAADRLELLAIDNEDLRLQNHSTKIQAEVRWGMIQQLRDHIQFLEQAGDAMVLYATTPTKTAWKQAKEDKP